MTSLWARLFKCQADWLRMKEEPCEELLLLLLLSRLDEELPLIVRLNIGVRYLLSRSSIARKWYSVRVRWARPKISDSLSVSFSHTLSKRSRAVALDYSINLKKNKRSSSVKLKLIPIKWLCFTSNIFFVRYVKYRFNLLNMYAFRVWFGVNLTKA